MNSAGAEDAREFVRLLEEKGYHPILIGGLAILIAGYGATKNVDVLVREAEYAGAEFLEGEGIEVFSNTGNFTNGRLTLSSGRTVAFDVLNPTRFVGSGHLGEEFFRFVQEEASTDTRYGRVALPSVVFYTRLLVPGPHGEAYVERIARDLDEGVPEQTLTDATQIAHRFGTEKSVRAKVAHLREIRRSRK